MSRVGGRISTHVYIPISRKHYFYLPLLYSTKKPWRVYEIFHLAINTFLIGCVGSPPGNGDIKQSYIEFPHVPGLMGSCHSGDLDLKTESIEESDHGVVYLPETNS